MFLKINFYILLILTVANGNSTLIQNYVDLINKETERAFNAPSPQDAYEYMPTSSKKEVFGRFDYIIVGAGSAGSVIANRLTENASTKVLLVEAGNYGSNFSEIPMMYMYLQRLEYSWRYNTTPQTSSCLGMVNRMCPYPRGKGLGGSSIINAIMYVRGNKEDYNELERMGNKGWAYEDVLPLFQKSEICKIPNGDSAYHGYDGHLNVEYRSPVSPQLLAFIDGNLELGRSVIDYNGKEQLGVSRTQFSTINGKRDSTEKAFIGTARNRKNLIISTQSLVSKILIGGNKQAYGITFSKKSGIYTAYARNEIIVSAGTVGSAQLLMLSGIGPRRHLKQMNIPVVQNLAVGNRLQDHVAYYALNFESNYVEPIKSREEYVRDYLNGNGPYTIASNAQGLGFFKTNNTIGRDVPDIELVFVPSNSSGDILKKACQYTDEVYDTTWKDIDPTRTFAIYVILLHPLSYGNIRLKSNNPYDYPLINTNFLSDVDGKDIDRLYQGIQLALEIIHTRAFRRLNAKLKYSPLPNCKHLKRLSREFWYCQIRYLAFEIYHPVGTCQMGTNPFKGAVVDPELKVHRVKRLRVADASIFPITLSAHTNAPAVLVGEKAAELIRNQDNQLNCYS